jgi:hypothetical protein
VSRLLGAGDEREAAHQAAAAPDRGKSGAWTDWLWGVMLSGSRSVKADVMDDHETTPAEPANAGASAAPESASVIMAAFGNSHAAERMVASLGHDLRHKARKGDVTAFVVSRHRDGSFKLVQSRVVTASGLAAAAVGFTTATMAGLLGAGSVLRGAKTVTGSARERQSHVRQDSQRLTEILDEVGRHSAVLIVLCMDDETGQMVAARAAERGSHSWHVPRAEFVAALDRLGDNYEWVRPAVVESATRSRPGE